MCDSSETKDDVSSSHKDSSPAEAKTPHEAERYFVY